MAHADPAGERPDVPDGDQPYGTPASGLSDAFSLIQAEIGLGESDLNSGNGCGPAYVECELQLECELAMS